MESKGTFVGANFFKTERQEVLVLEQVILPKGISFDKVYQNQGLDFDPDINSLKSQYEYYVYLQTIKNAKETAINLISQYIATKDF